MEELTLDQKRAVAVATARLRLQSSAAPTPAASPAAPQSDNRSASQVMIDQMDAASQPIRHPFDTIMGLATGTGGLIRDALMGKANKVAESVGGMVKPLGTLAKDSAALAGADVTVPPREDQEAMANAAGLNLIMTAGGSGLGKAVKAAAASDAVTKVIPEKLTASAANFRTPLPKVNLRTLSGDMAATAVGYGVGGAPGAAVAEALNLVRKSPMFRNATAAVQEAAARLLAGKNGNIFAAEATDAARAVGPIERPGLPPATLDNLQSQLNREQFPVGELKPPPEPPTEIPFDPDSVPKGPAPVTPRIIQQVKQQLAPSSPSAKFSVGKYTPRLLEEMPELADPALHGQHAQALFDAKLFEGFKARESAVIAAEDAVADTTRVAKAPIMKTIEGAITEAEKYANPKLTATLERLKATWGELPDQIPWPDFVKAKRAFFEANNGNSYQVRQVYRSLTDATGKVSTDLAKANKAYSIVRQGIDDSGIIKSGPAAGQRLRSQGVRPKGTSLSEQIQQVRAKMEPSFKPAETPAANLPLNQRVSTPKAAAPAKAPTIKETFERFRQQGTAKSFGSGLPESELQQSVDGYMENFKEWVRNGATEMTGKPLGHEPGISANYGTEQIRRGGGMGNHKQKSHIFTEKTGYDPGEIAEAIERHARRPNASNVIYDRVREVALEELRGTARSASGSVIARAMARGRALQPPLMGGDSPLRRARP